MPSREGDADARARASTDVRRPRVCSRMADAGALGRDAQRRRELAVVDLVVFRAAHRAGELPARCGSRRRVSAAEIHSSGRPRLLLKCEMVVQPRLVVGGQRDAPACPRAAVRRRCRLACSQFGRESGPQRLARAPERDQRLLAGLRLGAGRQHAGGGVARAGSGRALVEHRTAAPRCGQPPRDAEADHAGANDGDLGAVAETCRSVRQSAAPYAGMTQTGSMGVLSAAVPRHPRPYPLMMGILSAHPQARLRGSVNAFAVRWRSSLAQHETDDQHHRRRPPARSCSGPPWAKPMP